MKNIKNINTFLIALAVISLIGCATGRKKAVGGKGLANENFDDKKNSSSSESSSSSVTYGKTLTHSLTNNPMTSRVISRSNAQQAAGRLKSSAGRSDASAKKALISYIAANRLAGKSLPIVLDQARKLADIELKSGISKEISQSVKLEIGLAALQSKDYAMFDFMVLPLTESKNRKIKAAAFNALGVITLKEGRVPEAVQYFKQALKAVSDYEAAMLNLALVALRNGDTDTAKRMLGRVKNDWFTQANQLVVARQTGDKEKAGSLCKKILASRAHKPTTFNCGLYEWLANKNTKQAKTLINKALKMRGGSPDWDQKGYQVLNKMRGS